MIREDPERVPDPPCAGLRALDLGIEERPHARQPGFPSVLATKEKMHVIGVAYEADTHLAERSTERVQHGVPQDPRCLGADWSAADLPSCPPIEEELVEPANIVYVAAEL